MTILRIIALSCLGVVLAGGAVGLWVQSRDRAQMHAVWLALEQTRDATPERFDPAMLEGLPEVARRYLSRAIEPGTPLHRVVQLEMEGSFIMNGNALPMRARQILAPPGRGFVWQAEIGSGVMRFAGSDGFHAQAGQGVDSWTRFWLHNVIPLARVGGTANHARAAATRVMMESIWAPASLLPRFGAVWVQTGPDSAEIRFDGVEGIEPMNLTVDAEGNPIEVHALRWSDANAMQQYRLQPFGGRILQMGRHGGFLIPERVAMGNMVGTPDYAPFFIARVTSARF